MSRNYVALDVGGTKTAVGVVDEHGRISARRTVPTPELRAGGRPLENLITLGRAVVAEAGVAHPQGVGIALPGPVDPAEATMLAAPTIPEFAGIPLAPRLREAFGCPAAGENDGNACALAEARFGAGRGARSLVYVTISTGIGGGVVLDGRIFRGSHGSAGEIGHQVVVPEGGPPCDCGGRGCLEAVASGRGIARRAQQAGLPCITAREVAELARLGHAGAAQVWRDTALYLGVGLSNVINLLDPERIILGGGVGVGAADLLLDPVREGVRARCMPSLARAVSIVTAGLGEDLGLVSAAVLAMP